MKKRDCLIKWARSVERAASLGVFGKKIGFDSANLVDGPRAGAIEVEAGVDSPVMLRALQAANTALMRQFIPWDFVGDPACFMAGKRIRMEAGWPRDKADCDIRLSQLGQRPAGGGKWIVGRTECGSTLTAVLSDSTPHWLLSGTTGSGKTTALVSAVGQLARDGDNRLVLIDSKGGYRFQEVSQVRGRVGPVANDLEMARAALSWACCEMQARYNGGRDDRRVVVVIDEVQELADDEIARQALTSLVTKGREAGVHCIVATQHPVVANLGGATVRRNLVGKLALLVADVEASRVAVGGNLPRADKLLGTGDAYAVVPGATHRVQVAWYDKAVETGAPDMEDWPVEDSLPDVSGWPDGEQVGAALLAAQAGYGRVRFKRDADARGVTLGGKKRVNDLLKLARATMVWLEEQGIVIGPSARPGIETYTFAAKNRKNGVCQTAGRTGETVFGGGDE